MSNASLQKLSSIDIKKLLPVPALIFIISAFFIFNAYSNNKIPMSIELKGGTLVTARNPSLSNADQIIKELSEIGFDGSIITIVRDFSGNIWGVKIEIPREISADEAIEIKRYLISKGTAEGDVQIESIGPAISEMFIKQSIKAVVFAFLFMAIVVFIKFKTFVPSIAVILAALADIVESLGAMIFFGVALSPGSIIALLLLIGYSVDTDILLTTRLIKQRFKNADEAIKSAFQTGMTMQLTTLGAMSMLRLISTSRILDDIATVIIFGLIFDIINTWITNASILKIYVEGGGKL